MPIKSNSMSAILFSISLLSFTGLFFFRKVAKKVGLIDKPTQRKTHKDSVPLVGGLSIFTTITIYALVNLSMIEGLRTYLICSAILVTVSALDDKYDINPWVRLFIQAAISIYLVWSTNLYMHDLGNLFGTGPIKLSIIFGGVITMLGIIGAINAFNMVDGIDGLLGGLAIMSFAALAYLFAATHTTELMTLCFVFIAATLPYVLLNLGIPFGCKFKVFMGDAGSVFFGFTLIWLLLNASQNYDSISIRPVTALWVIALPLMDMVAIMIRRIRKGVSPLKPDREHIHHIFQRFGFSTVATLFILCSIAGLFAAFGIWGQLNAIPEHVMFVAFLVIFFIYYLTLSNIWKVTSFFRKHIYRKPRPHINSNNRF